MTMKWLYMVLWFTGTAASAQVLTTTDVEVAVSSTPSLFKEPPIFYTPALGREVRMKDYFPFMDSLAAHYTGLLGYPVTDYLLVWSNPWVVDSLAHTDYYYQKERGVFVENQREMVIFSPGISLLIPGKGMVDSLDQLSKRTSIDINIPEFKLRIMRDGQVLRECLVRVGRNDKQYLATAGRVVDLKTPTGTGSIVRVARDPYFVNPATGKRYTSTRRDDGRITRMPLIPWLEPEINGLRPGCLIHPTTNPETLGKASSHGCIGMTEKDAWHVYYAAPVGTKVVVRYDLRIINDQGDTLQLPDIYRIED